MTFDCSVCLDGWMQEHGFRFLSLSKTSEVWYQMHDPDMLCHSMGYWGKLLSNEVRV